jgi:acetyltransferase-like isoleucine patch superfamily enzyme
VKGTIILSKILIRISGYISRIRGLYYSVFFKKCGSRLYIKGKIFLNLPHNAILGKNIIIGPYCRIETVENNTDKVLPILTIGNRCSFEHFVHIYCAGKLTIGDDCMFASGSLVTDNNHGINPVLGKYSSQSVTSKTTIIGNNVWIGKNVSILSGSFIGDNSIIGANSLVSSKIPANSIAVGIPAKVIKKYNFDTLRWESI